MKINKKFCLGIVATILAATVAGCATNATPEEDNETNSNNGSTSDPVVEDSEYINYAGTASAITDEDITLITVDGGSEESNFEKITFNVSNETVISSDMSQEMITTEQLEEGNKVEVIYAANSPMTKSIPPITNAQAIVLRESNEEIGVKISTFDEDLISKDNSIMLKIDDDTNIVDLEGNTITLDDIIGEKVIAFYGPAMTLSLPAQSNAIKIILL